MDMHPRGREGGVGGFSGNLHDLLPPQDASSEAPTSRELFEKRLGERIAEVQKSLEHLQQEEIKLEAKYQEELSQLENQSLQPHQISLKNEDGKYYHHQSDGTRSKKISWGQVKTAAEWGIDYYLDPETFSSEERKMYLDEKYNFKRRELEDEKILLHKLLELAEGGAAVAHHNVAYWEIYRKQYSPDAKKNPERQKQPGIIAEKMARVFLTRLAEDFPELHVGIEKIDPVQDVQQKIDFIVTHKKKDAMGVYVEATEVTNEDRVNVERKGVQFTIKTSEEDLDKKRRQIATTRGDRAVGLDVKLVSVDLNTVKDIYDKWESQKAADKVFGPDELLDPRTRQVLFSKVMEGVLSEDEIKKTAGAIKNMPVLKIK